ncbi:uncharacterized protein LOC135398660 isoform X2 [Ornithodoros turicata]|uniref:uncharacterized protein LOC135398660 isoform X2 n=1 Tax=Ornithodoros turicata TaxID=34597 RepID=UPI00313A2411
MAWNAYGGFWVPLAHLLLFNLLFLRSALASTEPLENYGSCRYQDFIMRKQACEHSYNFLSTRNDSGCSLIQVYVDCVSNALITTSCTVNPFFKASETVTLQKKLAEKNLTCKIESEILSIGGHNKACLRVRAVKLFLQCGAKFHKSSENKKVPKATLCGLLKTYERCGSSALEDTNCTNDSILQSHIHYFVDVSMHKYASICNNVTDDLKLPVKSNVMMMRQTGECMVEEALRRYFTCGSNFLWKMVIWKRHFARHRTEYGLPNVTGQPTQATRSKGAANTDEDELCTAVKEFQECTLEITQNKECPNFSYLSEKMLTMQDILVGEPTKIECQYAPLNKNGPYPYFSRQNLPPPGCSYRKLVKLFSYCTVNFFSSFALAKDNTQACMFLGRHNSCVQQARRSTGCGMKVKELDDFVYLTNVVQDKHATQCRGQETSKLAQKKDIAGVPMLCKKKTLLQRYFLCSFDFQNQQALKKDQCQALEQFNKCFYDAKADTQCTYTDDQFISIMQMQTELMTETVKSHCTRQTDLNVLLKCSQADALEKMLLCGLSYNRLLEDLKKQGEYYVTATTCSYLAEYKHCMIEVERTTGCTKSQLYKHTATVLSFWTWNVVPLCESAAPLLLTDADPKCDFPKTLLKGLKCAIDFQTFAEQTTWDTMTSTQSCSSLETLDQCMTKALHVRQCKRSLSAKSQVSIFKALLTSEYKLSCTSKPYQAAPPPSFRKYDDYEELSDDYYYFGDEIVRTRQPNKLKGIVDNNEHHVNPKQMVHASQAVRESYAQGARQQGQRDNGIHWKQFIEEARLRFMGVSLPPGHTFGLAVSSNTSNDQLALNDTALGKTKSWLHEGDSQCDKKRYEEEIVLCKRYIIDNTEKLGHNLLSMKDQRTLQDNMCKLAEHYHVCMSEAARRNRCLDILAQTPQKVKMQLIELNLDMCISAGALPISSILVLALSLVILHF